MIWQVLVLASAKPDLGVPEKRDYFGAQILLNFLLCSGGDLEPAFRVLVSAIFHGVSLGNFHKVRNSRKAAEEKP
jgi:hypothetical protein